MPKALRTETYGKPPSNDLGYLSELSEKPHASYEISIQFQATIS
jgi:hypothetical protein